MASSEARSIATANRILDAAVSCLRGVDLDKVTMSDIIATSGLARTTVYRYFADRDDIICRLVLRDIDFLVKHLDNLRQAHKNDSIDVQLLEILDFIIREINRRPLLAELFSQDPIRLSRLGIGNEFVVQYSQQSTRPTFDMIESAGRLRPGTTLEDLSEWCGRIIMSFVTTPHRYSNEPEKMRQYIRNFIVPSMLS